MSGVTEFYGFEFSSRSSASPELNASQKCFKYTLVVVNTLFLIFGCVLCALGAYAVNSQAGALAGASLPSAIIAIGVFTILLAILGCGASWFEGTLALSIYFCVLTIICVLAFFLGIGVLVERNQSSSLIIQGWASTPAVAKQTLSEAFGCCGFTTWCDGCYCSGGLTCNLTQCTQCSSLNNANGYSCPATSVFGSTPLCLTAIQNSFNSYYQQAGGASIAFGVLMFVAMTIVCILMRGIRQKAYLEDVRNQHKKIREAKEDGGIDLTGIKTGLEGNQRISTRRIQGDANNMTNWLQSPTGTTSNSNVFSTSTSTQQEGQTDEPEDGELDDTTDDVIEDEELEAPKRKAPPPPPPPPPASNRRNPPSSSRSSARNAPVVQDDDADEYADEGGDDDEVIEEEDDDEEEIVPPPRAKSKSSAQSSKQQPSRGGGRNRGDFS